MPETLEPLPSLSGAIRAFGEELAPRYRLGAPGEPEDQLRGPFETLLKTVGADLGLDVVLQGETLIRDLKAKPDYSVETGGLLCGHVELKAPGVGVTTSSYSGHNREQWLKLRRLPNLLYCDGNSWALYRNGERVSAIATLNGDVRTSGALLRVTGNRLPSLLADFLTFHPIAPRSALELAQLIAQLCHLMRDEVIETMAIEAFSGADDPGSFTSLARDWRVLLFPGVTDDEFADYYAQTVTFSLLLASSEGEDLNRDLASVARSLSQRHGLLGKALGILTDDTAMKSVITSLRTMIRLISEVDWDLIAGHPSLPGFSAAQDSHWIYFYETFLAQYDPELRNRSGAYYTPPAVVETQVRLIDSVLSTRLGKSRLGIAEVE